MVRVSKITDWTGLARAWGVAGVVALVVTAASACRTPPSPERAPAQASASVPASVPEAAPAAEPPGGASSQQRLTPEQLQSRLRAFADLYRFVIADAADEIKRRRADPVLRQKAHRFKIDGATAIYDIAADPSPQQALLNILVLVTLQAYLAESYAVAEFPEDHPLIKEKAEFLKAEGWRLAASVMTESQRTEVHTIVDRWWADNADVREVWYVRILDLAGYGQGTRLQDLIQGARTLPAQILNAFVPVRDATGTLDEATAIAERTTWLAPRLLILAQWRAEAIVLESLAATEIKQMVSVSERAADVAERAAAVAETLPGTIGQQREALFNDLAEHEALMHNLLQDAQQTVGAVESATDSAAVLMSTTDGALAAADRLTASVDVVLARVERMQASGPEPAEPARPFDITEYTAAIQAATATLEETNRLVLSLADRTQPGELEERLGVLTAEGERLMDRLSADATRLIVTAAAAVGGAGVAIVLAAKLVPARRPAGA